MEVVAGCCLRYFDISIVGGKKMKLMSLILAIASSFIFTGCIHLDDPLPIKIVHHESININVKEVRIDKNVKDDIEFIRAVPGGLSFTIFNKRLKENLIKAIESNLKAVGQENILIVNIEKCETMSTKAAGKNIPIAELLFIGEEEEITANISLILEVENSNGKVLISTPIKASGSYRSALTSPEMTRHAHQQAIEKALENLQIEFLRQSNRVLYNYVISH